MGLDDSSGLRHDPGDTPYRYKGISMGSMVNNKNKFKN
jgi:hypothetical protein